MGGCARPCAGHQTPKMPSSFLEPGAEDPGTLAGSFLAGKEFWSCFRFGDLITRNSFLSHRRPENQCEPWSQK